MFSPKKISGLERNCQLTGMGPFFVFFVRPEARLFFFWKDLHCYVQPPFLPPKKGAKRKWGGGGDFSFQTFSFNSSFVLVCPPPPPHLFFFFLGGGGYFFHLLNLFSLTFALFHKFSLYVLFTVSCLWPYVRSQCCTCRQSVGLPCTVIRIRLRVISSCQCNPVSFCPLRDCCCNVLPSPTRNRNIGELFCSRLLRQCDAGFNATTS